MSKYTDNKIASVIIGSTGQPGSSYDCIWIGISEIGEGEFECRAKQGWGSNQVSLEEHGERKTRFRGESIKIACETVVADIIEWDHKSTTKEREAAMRELEYDALDALDAI